MSGAIPLSQLAKGEVGEVVGLDEACQGFLRRRFLDLGLTPGAQVAPELGNFFGDPRAYRVRGALIALRNDQARKVYVRRIETNQHAIIGGGNHEQRM